MGNFDRTRWFYSVFKMDVTIWLSVLLAVITLGTPVSSNEPRVVCYYTNWSVYRPGTARFNPQNINPYLCTHLIYAFGGFTKDNSLKPFDKYQDIEKGGYAKFTGLKTYNKNLKTLLAIGGWNEGSTRFSAMVASRERRKEFVRNAIKFLRQNRFDGLDLDWEYPAFRDGGKPKDKEHYSKFVKELREEFDMESEKTGKPRLLLTMAVPAGIEYIQKGFDVMTLNRYLDWMNLLTYDYHSAFEPAVNHHAPLYPYEEPNEYSVDTELNIDYTIKFYLEHGADADKLVLGIPTYGRSYTLFNPDAVELGSPADGPGEQGDATREKGYLAYYEICEAVKQTPKKRSPGSDEDSDEYEDEKEDKPWTVMYPNAAAMGPVAYRGNQWVGYDDEEIVRKKAEYVADHKLGGIMFWSIDNDDFRGTCHGKPYPLIEAAKESYYAKLGSTINTIAQTTQTTPARPSSKRKQRPKTTSTTTTTTTTDRPTARPSAGPSARPSSGPSARPSAGPSARPSAGPSSRPSSGPSPQSSPNSYNLRVTSTTPVWTIVTPEPPTTPDPGSDFKCVDEGFFQHPRDCKKYFWCLDSGPSNLGIVAHQFTCPSGLYFNKAADSCDFARNVPCKKPATTTKAPTTAPSVTTTTTARTTTTTRKAFLSTKNSVLFRTTSLSTSTTPKPKIEEYDDEVITDEDAEDPKVIKELIDLIKKVGGIEQLEKQLHIGESSSSSVSISGLITTTPSSFNKKLYQKVLNRTRGQNKYTGNNNIIETLTQTVQNSRGGPQNAGLEPSQDREDKPLRKERPQYVTINRQRGSTTTTATPADSEEDYEEVEEEKVQSTFGVPPVEGRKNVASTAKPLQYVNIRRGRPNTSDTADDIASRNALFERQDTLSTKSETSNIVDAVSSRREVKPEYVTIRRQRPTTEETTTQQYRQSEEEEEIQTTLLEREISTQPKYNTIVRSQTTQPPDEPSTRAPIFKIYTLQTDTPPSPEPTTVLAVQIASLLNSLNSSDIEYSEIETETPTAETDEPTAASTTTSTTTTTTTRAPPPRRTTVARRRGVTTKTTPAPSSTTQVSPRNYTIVRRRRPLRGPNEIISDSDDSNDLSRKIRSTTPDSREVSVVNETVPRRFRGRFQGSRFISDDSIPAAASPIVSGQIRSNDDEEISLTTVEVEPKFVPRQRFNLRTDRRYPRPSTASGVDFDTVPDSEVSAATVEARRPALVTRGRNRFTLSSTTEATFRSTIAATLTPRRPTFGRFSPRPFTRPPPTPADINEEIIIEGVTQRSTLRLPFSRARPTPAVVGRKLPFPSRQSTTQQALVSSDNDDDDDEPEIKADDILLSESAREEKEHDEPEPDLEEEVPKRKIIIKKLRATTSTSEDVVISTETVPIETDNADTGKKRFRVIRRRPSSSTTTEKPVVSSESPTGPGLQRIRKIIRKKLRPTEIEPKITAKTLDLLNTFKDSTTEVFNYGERTKAPLTTTTTEEETEPNIQEVTEFYKEEKKVGTTTVEQNIETNTEVAIEEPVTEKVVETIEKEQVQKIAVETTTITNNNSGSDQSNVETLENIEDKSKIVTGDTTNIEQSLHIETKPEEENKNVISANKEEIYNKSNSKVQTVNKVEVAIATEEKGIDISDKKETETEPFVTETNAPETTTTSTTVSTTPSSRSRLPYRPRKKLFTPSTEPSVPSTSKTFSRKYNPGAYTSPASVDRPQFKPSGAVTRRPFSSKFTRRPFTTKTTEKVEEEEEYSDEDAEVEEHEQENRFVIVPPNQLFTRKPESIEEDDEELLEEGEGDENDEEEDEQAAKRGFLRRTKATAPPETTETIPIDNTDTTTNKYTRRGNSKFKQRKELPKIVEKNEIENRLQRPSLNGGARRSERPPATRKFVSRRRFGGANSNSTLVAAASTTTAVPTTTRRLNRIISRRRQSTTTTSTTTAPTNTTLATTKEDEYYDSLPEIGDTDAIEDPTLEPKKPKASLKVQRRPLVLKDPETDQNPSATNEEENKRQSKKYSASIKQIQLDDLVKKVQEESSTEKQTTVEDISPETAVAIAAHQLITAPIPSLTDFEDDDIKPTRNIQTTVEYKYSSREYNEYTNSDSKTPTYDDYQSTPIYKTNTLENDETTVYKTQTDFDFANASDVDIPKTTSQKYITTPEYKTIDYIQTTLGNSYAVDIDSAKISTYDVPKATNFPDTASTARNQDYGRTTTTDYIESKYDSPKIISTTFPSKSPSSKTATNTVTGQSFSTIIEDSYTNGPIDFASNLLGYLPKSGYQSDPVTQNYIRSTNTFPETSTEFVSKYSPSYVPNFASTTYSNSETFDDTVLEENLPRSRISTTLSPPQTSRQAFERTTASVGSNSPRTASSFTPRATEATKLRNDFRSNLATNAVTIGYSGNQRGTSRFRNEKLIPVPVDNSGYSTVGYTRSSQEPSYFTREYLLESPVTKTYDDEYQYLLPITTPQTPPPSATRKVIRKKIHRKISTTQAPTSTPLPPLSTTAVIPRRVPAKPFDKVPKEKKKTYRPIANYDYYDDGDEKVAVKYMEGTKVVMHENGTIECLDIGNFPHPTSCKKFISCARIENGSLLGWEYICPKGLSFDPVGGICNWSAGLGCNEKDA